MTIMTYMNEKEQKNFTLPLKLIAAWGEFQPQGSQEHSRNAAGALFLYMLMPSHIREVACDAAYEDNLIMAQDDFWSNVDDYLHDVEKAKALVGAVKALEAKQHKKKGDKAAGSA